MPYSIAAKPLKLTCEYHPYNQATLVRPFPQSNGSFECLGRPRGESSTVRPLVQIGGENSKFSVDAIQSPSGYLNYIWRTLIARLLMATRRPGGRW